jgi:benzoyl-CoA reductase subunit B
LSSQIWETRPLEIWGKAKELRARWQRSIDESAAAPGSLLAHGNAGEIDWSVGFDSLNIVEDNPHGAMLASLSDEYARKCRLASETRGWGRELCGYVNNCWGSMFLGYQLDGSGFPMRDMSVPFPDVCDQHTKRGQQCMDYSPIPRWGGDCTMYLGPYDPDREKALVEHKVQCTLGAINDIERIFGKEFDDEKLVKGLGARPQMEKYGLEITRLMARTPAPLSSKELYSFFTIGMLTKVDPDEALGFWKALRDETKWRADNRIAAVGNERYRMMEAHPPAWHYLKFYRYLEKYGAVCIGSQYTHTMSGPLELKEDGTLGPRTKNAPPPDRPVRTREDALRRIFSTDARGPQVYKIDEYIRPRSISEFATGMGVNGAIMPLWRCGVGCTLTRKEQALQLNGIGISVLHYEGSQPGDRTDMDERRFLDQIDVWMEGQGFGKLED